MWTYLSVNQVHVSTISIRSCSCGTRGKILAWMRWSDKFSTRTPGRFVYRKYARRFWFLIETAAVLTLFKNYSSSALTATLEHLGPLWVVRHDFTHRPFSWLVQWSSSEVDYVLIIPHAHCGFHAAHTLHIVNLKYTILVRISGIQDPRTRSLHLPFCNIRQAFNRVSW